MNVPSRVFTTRCNFVCQNHQNVLLLHNQSNLLPHQHDTTQVHMHGPKHMLGWTYGKLDMGGTRGLGVPKRSVTKERQTISRRLVFHKTPPEMTAVKQILIASIPLMRCKPTGNCLQLFVLSLVRWGSQIWHVYVSRYLNLKSHRSVYNRIAQESGCPTE